jgi:uncharacterized UBP type Zn finger protein
MRLSQLHKFGVAPVACALFGLYSSSTVFSTSENPSINQITKSDFKYSVLDGDFSRNIQQDMETFTLKLQEKICNVSRSE